MLEWMAWRTGGPPEYPSLQDAPPDVRAGVRHLIDWDAAQQRSDAEAANLRTVEATNLARLQRESFGER